MKMRIETTAPMDNIYDEMKNVAAQIKEKTGRDLEYQVYHVGSVTEIMIPQVSFIVKKGRLSGLSVKLKKRAVKTAMEMALLRHDLKAKIEIE